MKKIKKVPFSYLDRQFRQAGPGEKPLLADLIFQDLKDFLKTGDFTLGRKLEEFEARFAGLIGVRHALGVGSGTDALLLSLKALGIGPGDEVITSAETFIATAGAVAMVGAKPVFVDAGDDYLIDAGKIEAAITPRTKALLPVYFTGDCPDMDRILDIAARHGLPVVEDSCCAIDASIDGKRAGSFGITGTFSFHPLKNLNVWSDGGMVTTDDDAMAAKIRLLRNHGLKNRDEVACFGHNSRLDSLQAVVGLRMIGDAGAITDQRIAVAKRYDEAFADIPQIEIPKRKKGVRHVFHLYMLRVQDRDRLVKHCQERGVEAKVHYPIALPLQECCRNLGHLPGDFPNTERDCACIISLPAHQHLSSAEVARAIEVVREFYGK